MNPLSCAMSAPLDSPQAAATTSSPTLHSSPSSPSSQQLLRVGASGPCAMMDDTNRPMRNYDGTEMRDAQRRIVYKSQFLSTHPLRSDCKERVGYGGKKFTYVSGDGVIRTMNAIFGHGGWSSKITMQQNVLNEKDERGRWNVGYLATVRVTLLNGVSHEDCGSGEGIDNNKCKAHEKALKSAITDAMKRAARHYGERLGNALYVKGSGIRTAPRTNRDALLQLETKDALNLFGDQAALRQQCQSPEKTLGSAASSSLNATAAAIVTTNNAGQKENWPQNRDWVTTAGQQKTSSSASSTVLPSPIASTAAHRVGGASQPVQKDWTQNRAVGQPAAVNTGQQQQKFTSSAPSTVLPSPIASTAVQRNGASQMQQSVVNNAGVRAGNQQQQQQFASSSSSHTVLPSPTYVSTTVHHNNSSSQAHHGVNNAGVRGGNPSSQSSSNNNNAMPQRSLINAPEPPNLMAPPPRPMYNPGGGAGVQYGGVASRNNANQHPGGKRSSDGIGNHNNNAGYNNVNGDDGKRQKVNPYSNSTNTNNNGNKRYSY